MFLKHFNYMYGYKIYVKNKTERDLRDVILKVNYDIDALNIVNIYCTTTNQDIEFEKIDEDTIKIGKLKANIRR